MPTLVSLKHTCFICHRNLTNAQRLRQHLLSQHQINVPSVSHGARRFNNDDFIYVKNADVADQSTVFHVACPSCLLHYSELSQLKEHVEATHISIPSTSAQSSHPIEEYAYDDSPKEDEDEPLDPVSFDLCPVDSYLLDDNLPSDLTIDYHPGRKDDYYFDENCDYSDENNLEAIGYDDTEEVNVYSWTINSDDNTDIIEMCYQYKSNTLTLPNPVEQMSDLRLLVLHDIYLFDTVQQSTSISKDWNHRLHNNIIASLPVNQPPRPLQSPQWCFDISQDNHDDWMIPLSTAASHLNEAIATRNTVDVHTMQSMLQLLPIFVAGPPDCSLEDSYIHKCIAPIIKPIFDCEPLLKIDWANHHLNKKYKANKVNKKTDVIKPDFAAGVKAVHSWVSVIVGEFKPPGFSPRFESDLVKIGKEMRCMVNDLVRLGISNPSVGGILIQGRKISTFQFDLIAPKLYRMIKLSKLTMFESLGEIVSLPAIVTRMMQVKEIAMNTAEKVQVLMNQRKTTMKHIPATNQQYWISDGGFTLRKRTLIKVDDDERQTKIRH